MRTVRALLNATARTQRASPKRNNDSFPRMLAAVAAASVVTTTRLGIRNWPVTEATPSTTPRTAAILARKRGDISVIRCVIGLIRLLRPPCRERGLDRKGGELRARHLICKSGR